MTLMPVDPQRAIIVNSVRGLIADARAERALLRADSPERQFYLGVDAAAEEILHPELRDARAANWLDGETPAFREGYLRTSILLSTAITSEEPPLHLRLPAFDLAS